jgi:hypothetical protein
MNVGISTAAGSRRIAAIILPLSPSGKSKANRRTARTDAEYICITLLSDIAVLLSWALLNNGLTKLVSFGNCSQLDQEGAGNGLGGGLLQLNGYSVSNFRASVQSLGCAFPVTFNLKVLFIGVTQSSIELRSDVSSNVTSILNGEGEVCCSNCNVTVSKDQNGVIHIGNDEYFVKVVHDEKYPQYVGAKSIGLVDIKIENLIKNKKVNKLR